MSTVYVLVEHDGSQVSPVTGELITAARPLGEVTAVVVGAPGVTTALAPALAEAGAAAIVAAEAPDAGERLILPQVDALHTRRPDRQRDRRPPGRPPGLRRAVRRRRHQRRPFRRPVRVR